MFSTDATIAVHASKKWQFFSPNTFDPQLVESEDMEPMDMEGQLYYYSPHFTDEEIAVEQFKSFA